MYNFANIKTKFFLTNSNKYDNEGIVGRYLDIRNINVFDFYKRRSSKLQV